MSNVLSDDKRQQILALGRLGWPLRRIEHATGVRRETASAYLKAAGIAIREPRQRRPPANPASPVSTDPAKPASEVSTDPALLLPGPQRHGDLAGPCRRSWLRGPLRERAALREPAPWPTGARRPPGHRDRT